MTQATPTMLLLAIASGSLPDVELRNAWDAWRAHRPEIGAAPGVEVALLPAALDQLKAAGESDPDAARLDGLQRKAAVGASLVISELAAAQERLRSLGIATAVGGGAAAILCGAYSLGQRSVSHGHIWVSRRDLRRARSSLVEPPASGSPQRSATAAVPARHGIRLWLSGACAVGHRRLILHSRLPTVPPTDARPLLAHTRPVQWQHARLDVLRPTELVFLSDAAHGVDQAVRRVGGRGRTRYSWTAESALRRLDRERLRQVNGYSDERLRDLLAAAGWRAPI